MSHFWNGSGGAFFASDSGTQRLILGVCMRHLAFNLMYLILGQILVVNAWALDPNACKNPTKDGYTVQNVNSKDPISLISHSDAVKLFNELKNPKYKIPYLNANNNCDARGHQISQILKSKYNISTIKIFVEAVNEVHYGAGAPSFMRDDFVDDGSRVVLDAKDILGNYHTWSYHTAPAVCVRKNGKDELYVFDLSLFSEPVPYNTWKNKMTDGLSPSAYEVSSTNMYSMMRQGPDQPAKTQFENWETSMMKDALSKDWSGHQRLLRQHPTASSPTHQTTIN